MEDKYILSCLIPMYNEGEEVIKPLLDSIAIQQNVDFNRIEAVITNDGILDENDSNRLSEDFINSYPFDIKYSQIEHAGVSATRNYCLDNCGGEYVMFCDADDMFFNACGLWMVLNELKKNSIDYYSSMFIEESRVVGDWGQMKPFYINRENDSTFVHGKVIRRQFLIDNNIRWNENLTIHEDSYFNCLCHITAQRLTQKIQYCPTAFYLWKYREDSICRQDPLYLNKTYVKMYDSNTELVTECVKRNFKEDAINLVVNMVYESYYMFNTDKWWSEEGHEYMESTEKRFKQYWLTFKNIFDIVSPEKKRQLVFDLRKKYFDKGLIDMRITFADWIKHIEEL